MELVAMDMKARGLFLARTLSYENAEFGITNCEMTEEDISLYDDCCQMWMTVRRLFDKEIGVDKTKKKTLNGAYWSAHQRFFKEMCLSTKVKTLVDIAKKAVEVDNMCVVIGMQSTGEAAMNRQMDRDDVEEGQ